MTHPASITIIDGSRFTEERARAARAKDAPDIAAIGVVVLICIAAGIAAIAMGA